MRRRGSDGLGDYRTVWGVFGNFLVCDLTGRSDGIRSVRWFFFGRELRFFPCQLMGLSWIDAGLLINLSVW